ncbi:MAG: hypothetical protein HYR56_17720, partial [Acidobacteria bacterium]|nr:hypothetical protein [Acidobacteriota bacterium]MBI3424203.1 hypothetical protein [Acidobacteriota bacterium]
MLDNTDGVSSTYAYAGGEYVAQGYTNSTVWTHYDPYATKRLQVNSSGNTLTKTEFDPLGAAAEVQDLTNDNINDAELVFNKFGASNQAL